MACGLRRTRELAVVCAVFGLGLSMYSVNSPFLGGSRGGAAAGLRDVDVDVPGQDHPALRIVGRVADAAEQ
jgi:hypothetical protein